MRNIFRRKKTLNVQEFTQKWQALQKHCVTRKTWPLAIAEGDKLLCEALKKSRFKGKTDGARLVAAQRILTNNEGVWFGHKFRKQIDELDVRTLKKQDIMDALTGFRQALRDLGALEK